MSDKLVIDGPLLGGRTNNKKNIPVLEFIKLFLKVALVVGVLCLFLFGAYWGMNSLNNHRLESSKLTNTKHDIAGVASDAANDLADSLKSLDEAGNNLIDRTANLLGGGNG